MDLTSKIKREFQLESGVTYLNHAAVAPWPSRTSEAVNAFSTENLKYGAQHYPRWNEVENNLRTQFAQLINAPAANDISILKNTSEALSIVAYGLTWQPGDNIVISNQEFPSNKIVWHSLKKFGVEVREVDIGNYQQAENLLLEACDNNTKLLSISSVQYASGLRMKLQKLGLSCKERGILFCVDAIQSLGALRFDVQEIHADFVMADTHKWMLGPEGVALFYCREDLRERLTLHEYGWHMLQDMTNFDSTNWEFAHSGRRFECGSPNMLGIHAANASLSLLLEAGMSKVESALLERTTFTFEKLNKYSQFDVLSAPDEDRLSGIVTFRSSKLPSLDLYQKLMENNVICAHRGGGVRFSAHFYTDLALIDDAINLAALSD